MPIEQTVIGLGPNNDDAEKRVIRWNYYASPEGEDFATKMFAMNGLALLSGVTVAMMDSVTFSQPKNMAQAIGRFGYVVAPFVGCATAFTATTFAATRIRGKDDPFNYFLGGAASGAVYGAWRRCNLTGFVVGMGLGLFGVAKKVTKDNGEVLNPAIVKTEFNSLWSVSHDFTYLRDPPKGWTSNPAEV